MPNETVYIEFPSGTAYPDGYIAPGIVMKRIEGHTRVLLSPIDHPRLDWAVWVRNEWIVPEEELVAG